jgi:small subunit ribosomal protein S17
MTERGQAKYLLGDVLSNAMNKTIVVKVSRRIKHPKYGKYLNVFKKYYAHDEKNEAKVGDKVKIISSKPISKTKKWKLINITKKVEELL